MMEAQSRDTGSARQTFYSDADVDRVRELVQTLELECSELDSKIVTLHGIRQIKEASLAAYRASLSPVMRTPTEIWEAIFLCTLPDQSHNPIISTAHSPLLLTHVCRSWRKIALGLPNLWAAIHVPIIIPASAPQSSGINPSTSRTRRIYDIYSRQCNTVMTGRRAMMEEWLFRAKTASLSITLDQTTPRTMHTPTSREVDTTDISLSVVSLLRSRAAQWGSLQLHCRPPLTALLLQGLGPSDVPNLHSISFADGTISHGGSVHPYTELLTLRIFQSPSLRSFRPPPLRDSLTWPSRFGSLGVRMRALTSLHIPDTIGKVSTTEVLTLLAECPLLTRLYVYTTCKTPHITLPGPPEVLLARLEDLSWKEDDKESFNGTRETSLLSYLIAPSLHTLSLQFPRHLSQQTDVDVPEPLRGLPTCGQRVKTISVEMGRLPLTSSQVRQFLRSIPSVESLVLICNISPGVGEDLFQILSLPNASTPSGSINSLTPTPDAEILCPKLKSLTWKSQCPDFYEESLLNFIQPRRNTSESTPNGGVAKLKTLQIVHLLPRPGFGGPPCDGLAHTRLLAALVRLEGGTDVEGFSVDIPYWPPFPVPDHGWSASFGTTPVSRGAL